MFTGEGSLSTELSTNIPQMTSIFAIIVHFGDQAVTDSAQSSLMKGIDRADYCIVVDHGTNHQDPLNKGYAAGLIEGIRNARLSGAKDHDLLLLLNNDIEIVPNSIDKLRRWWSEYGGPTVIAGASWGSVSLLTGRATITHERYVSSITTIPYLHGSCIALEYGVAAKMMPREDFFMYWEDVEFSIRAALNGVTLTRIPFPLVQHNDNVGRSSSQKLYYLVRNGAYVLEHKAPYVWKLYWHIMNTMRWIYHSIQRSHTHQTIARGLSDARKGKMGKMHI